MKGFEDFMSCFSFPISRREFPWPAYKLRIFKHCLYSFSSCKQKTTRYLRNCGSVFVDTLSPTTESLGYDHANLKQASSNIMITGHSRHSCHCDEHCLVLITSFLKEEVQHHQTCSSFPIFQIYEKCHHPSNSRNPQFPRFLLSAGCFGDDLPAICDSRG